MKKLTLLIGLFLGALTAHAIKNGDSLEQVLKEKGAPTRRLEAGANILLTYPDGSVKLTDGKVVSVKSTEELTRADYKYTPAPGAATGSSAKAGSEFWTTDAAAAEARARAENKKQFLFFTGSDWCVWCQRLDREVLTTVEFSKYAKGHLVLVKLDFPNSIPQPDEVKAQNHRLSQQYRIQGYPTIIVLDAEGKKLGELGYQPGGPGPFIKALQAM
jgi:thioredoxin-related protein